MAEEAGLGKLHQRRHRKDDFVLPDPALDSPPDLASQAPMMHSHTSLLPLFHLSHFVIPTEAPTGTLLLDMLSMQTLKP